MGEGAKGEEVALGELPQKEARARFLLFFSVRQTSTKKNEEENEKGEVEEEEEGKAG